MVRTVGKAESAKALCRFVAARTQEGQLYADEWLSCAALAAVPSHALAGEGRCSDEAGAGEVGVAEAAGADEAEVAGVDAVSDTFEDEAEVAGDDAVFDMFEYEEDLEPLEAEGGADSLDLARVVSDGSAAPALVREHSEVLLRNSRVYAARAEGGMNGMFALVPCKRGDVLVAYTGRLLSEKEAAASGSEYLLKADKVAQRKPWSRRLHRTEIDGRGELGGYANYACAEQANAVMLDVLHSLVKAGRRPKHDTMMLLVAACDVEAGQEIRFNYDGDDTGFREAMIARGIQAAALDSGAYREARWRATAWAMMNSQRNICADCSIRALADVPKVDVEKELANRGGGFEDVGRG